MPPGWGPGEHGGQGGAGAWPGDAAKLLTAGQTSADQIIQLQNAAHAPALVIFTLALRSVLQLRNAPIPSVLISLVPASLVEKKKK